MPELILTLLRLIFLALIFLFVWQVARAVAGHLGLRPFGRNPREGNRLVVVRSDSQPGLNFTVDNALVLGRSDEADVVIHDPYASEFHLRLTSQDHQLTVNDLGSTNGTYVNGRRISAATTLRRGDALQVGKTVMEVR
ncbi:MAG TPA: FHA domain-containing protein [Acidimicrobiia bacterium]|jgi:hypothetical protein